MQYLEYAVAGIAFLIFLAVVIVVVVGLLVGLARRAKTKPTTATLYPIPPAERGTGKHVSLNDLVDDHLAAEEQRRRRQKLNEKLYDLFQGSDPKAP